MNWMHVTYILGGLVGAAMIGALCCWCIYFGMRLGCRWAGRKTGVFRDPQPETYDTDEHLESDETT